MAAQICGPLLQLEALFHFPRSRPIALLACISLLFSAMLRAQEAASPPASANISGALAQQSAGESPAPSASADSTDTRAGQIDQERQQKAQNLHPEQISFPHHLLTFLGYLIPSTPHAAYSGFHLADGGIGLSAGPGFAAQPEGAQLQTSAQLSVTDARMADVQLNFPPQPDSPWSFDLYSAYRDDPGVMYYGEGPNSLKGSRTDYLLESGEFTGTAEAQIAPHFYAVAQAGYLTDHIGAGERQGIATTQAVFGPLLAPESNFAREGFLLEFDNRDYPLAPQSGGMYRAAYSVYEDVRYDLYNFQRLDLEAQHYFPFFNEQRVVAVSARTSMATPVGGGAVPFYLQPALGGAYSLRGYRTDRFYGNNSMLGTAEYRWAANAAFDMVVFADAGKVATVRSQLNFGHLQADAGFGIRFVGYHKVVMRTDIAFSREGIGVWLVFQDMFNSDVLRPPLLHAIF